MQITQHRAIQLIGARLTGDLGQKDFMDGWPSNADVAFRERSGAFASPPMNHA
jgi:hypothetical protein